MSLIDRLRNAANGFFDTHPRGDYGICDEAADELEAMQAEIDRRDEALSWAEGHDPWLVEKIRERASLDRQGK